MHQNMLLWHVVGEFVHRQENTVKILANFLHLKREPDGLSFLANQTMLYPNPRSCKVKNHPNPRSLTLKNHSNPRLRLPEGHKIAKFFSSKFQQNRKMSSALVQYKENFKENTPYCQLL